MDHRSSKIWDGIRDLVSATGLALALTVSAAHGHDRQAVAVIDVQQVLRDSSAIQAMKSRAEGLRMALQTDVSAKEEALREKDRALQAQRADLTPAAFEQKRLDFETEVVAAHRDFQARKQRLDAMLSRAMREVQDKLTEVVQVLAEERGADLVLAKSNVILVNTEMELTDEALARLNSALPAVPFPGAGE